jgi:DNA repair protein RecN (Recombination protein N)
MLRELHISNLAIIEDVHVELDDALTVFTGATGAGKSLVIGALQFLLGTRSSAQTLRPGASEGRVSGTFFVANDRLRSELGQLADVAMDEPELLITRRLLANGRGSCTVNGQPVTVSMLQQIGERLIDIHGQYDHQFLLSPSNQLRVLDAFVECEDLREQVAVAHRAWQDAQAERAKLAEGVELRRQQLELFEFQAAEIDEAAVKPGELESVEARHRRLANIDKIRQIASTALGALAEDDGLVDRLRAAVRDLSDLVNVDEKLRPIVEPCTSAILALEEASNDLRRYIDSLEFDKGELAEVEARLSLLRRLCDKYGGSIEGVLAYRNSIEADMTRLRQQQEDWSQIDNRIAEGSGQFDSLAKKIAAKRRSAARKLTSLINPQLAELGMDKAVFEMQLTEAEPGPTGRDAAEMMVQTNPGQPIQPLRRIASGGELSRIMLAIKSALSGTDRSTVLVFDEVDAHVGGRLGGVIGEKLRRLAKQHQVICITHLPQIAAYATRHLSVQKTVQGEQTRTAVRVVQGQDRIEELAEMIAGPNKTPTSRRQAKELIEKAEGKRQKAEGRRQKDEG